MEFERKEVVRQPEQKSLETDAELVKRFSIDVFKAANYVVDFTTCTNFVGTEDCNKCKLFRNQKCDLIYIKQAAENIMWYVKDK